MYLQFVKTIFLNSFHILLFKRSNRVVGIIILLYDTQYLVVSRLARFGLVHGQGGWKPEHG